MYTQTVTNETVEKKLEETSTVILDVRETEEYAFGHIPGAVLIPLGQLEKRCNELDREQTIFVICRTGRRSSEACYILEANAFKHVYNVLPGMIEWTGAIDSDL